MVQRFGEMLRKFDWLLFGSAALLSGLGLLALYSIGLGVGGSGFLEFKKQLIFFAIAAILALTLPFVIHYRWLTSVTRPLYAGLVALLLVVLIFGRTIRGATGWLYLGPVGIQPVEIAKVVLIIIMARFLAVHGRYTRDLKTVIQSAVTVALMLLLIMLQPDLGGAVVLAAVWFIMVAVSGMKWRHILTMVGVLAVVGIVAWFALLKPYQKDRLLTFLHPTADPFGAGYNVTQSVIAIGAGELTGRGVASGSQSQLRFLPEAPTDFIYSVIAEELGFVGVAILLGLFGLMFFRLYRLARKCPDDFPLFLVVGTAALIVVEVGVNVGVASGVLPVTGIALPFVSAGGSSLLTRFLLIAIVESIAIRQ